MAWYFESDDNYIKTVGKYRVFNEDGKITIVNKEAIGLKVTLTKEELDEIANIKL